MKSKAIKKIGSLVLAVCITLSVFDAAVVPINKRELIFSA